ncbi:hypothetical protein [Flavobacterium sp. CF136]|uniref:hypothetical protein n=1 Tax=Flavobacterium sp. (strain CF136) TaxID=1144313 RepID=UPI00027185D3|nr:hypothetical protein [Flavobacterium sp. CF136]EJL59262.1 hypothetical protein PMI10_04332 [Flavobacterium sp. CF136]
MIISKIEKDVFLYYNLHAEQTITGTFFNDSICSGIFDEQLTISTLEVIDKDLDKMVGIDSKIVVLDLIRLKDASNNLKVLLFNISTKCQDLIFTNIKSNVFSKLDLELSNKHNVKNGNDYSILYYSPETKEYTIEKTDDLFDSEFKKIIIKYNKDNIPEYHESSSVYLTKYIDIKEMISVDKAFFIYALYQLALKIKSNWLDHLAIESERPTLICQNLNSSYIASVLSSFLRLDILILDHLGPVNTMYSSLNNKIEEEKSYIIVSDVVCLGTEVKIAKNIITFLKGKVFGNIAIVKINTLLEDHMKKEEKKMKTLSVFNISKDNNDGIDFEIKTAFTL